MKCLPVAALLAVASGCVIPIAPEFEDPEVNYPPYVVRTDPRAGEIITPPPGEQAEIEVTLGDPNVRDPLYVRWVFDYPKYDPSVSRLAQEFTLPPAPNGGQERGRFRIAPSCSVHGIALGASPHRLMMIASDRPFVKAEMAPEENRYDTPSPGGYVVRAMWILNLECR